MLSFQRETIKESMWVSKLESCICGYFWHKQICMCIFWELTIPSGTIYKWYSKLLIKVIPKLFVNSMLFGSCKPGAFGAQYEGSPLLGSQWIRAEQSFPSTRCGRCPHLSPPSHLPLSSSFASFASFPPFLGPQPRNASALQVTFPCGVCSFNFGVRCFLRMMLYQKL